MLGNPWLYESRQISIYDLDHFGCPPKNAMFLPKEHRRPYSGIINHQLIPFIKPYEGPIFWVEVLPPYIFQRTVRPRILFPATAGRSLGVEPGH